MYEEDHEINVKLPVPINLDPDLRNMSIALDFRDSWLLYL